MSVVLQEGGARADKLFELLCAGPLAPISATDYAQLLRGAAAEGNDLIEQAPDGTLMLAQMGERLAFGKDFYAIFESDDEWRLVSSGRTLGTVPIANVLGIGSLVGFAGRRWRVQAVDDFGKVLDVVPHPSGRLPKFDRLSSEQVHDRLSAEMLSVYQARDLPAYLDAPALRLLSDGRSAFEEYELDRRRLIRSGRDTHLLLWRGTALNSVFAVMLASAGLECEAHDIGVTIADCSPDELAALVAAIPACPPVEDLAAFVENLRVAKYDQHVPDALLRHMWARRNAGLVPQVTAALREVQSALGTC
jgi:ATP-dependent Lhr-like helicase